MKTKRQPAGTSEVPAVPVLRPGDQVDIIEGAHVGTWGIVIREHLPGFHWVKVEGSDSPTHRRLFTRKQLAKQTPTA